MAKGPVALGSLFPVKVQWCGPKSFGSADAQDVCFGDDMLGYVIKKDSPPSGPHCEWFCANLATSCGINCPNFNVIDHTDGHQWFGSQWIPGQVADWWLKAEAGQIAIADLSVQLSRLYVFDLFMANVDRHLRNYLIIPEGNSHEVYAMDFGRSWRFNGFPPSPLPMDSTQNTVQATRYLMAKFPNYFDVGQAESVLDKINLISAKTIEDIIDKQPASWLTAADKADTIAWWTTKNVTDRTDVIRKGLHDGTIF